MRAVKVKFKTYEQSEKKRRIVIGLIGRLSHRDPFERNRAVADHTPSL